VVPWLDEVDEEDDWRWRFIDGEWSVDEERDGKVLDVLLFGWRGRSVRGPVGINVGDWRGERFWLSCSFDIRARFIDPKYVFVNILIIKKLIRMDFSHSYRVVQ